MTQSMLAETEARAEPAASVDVVTDNPATFKNVLVGVDGTSTGRDAIALAQKLCDVDGRLTLAHIVLVQQPGYENFHSTGAGKKTSKMLEREREATGVPAELTGMFAPSVGWGLRQLARDISADLLVVGSCARRPVARLFRGDDTRRTWSRATLPVAVAPSGCDRHDRRGIRRHTRVTECARRRARPRRPLRSRNPRAERRPADRRRPSASWFAGARPLRHSSRSRTTSCARCQACAVGSSLARQRRNWSPSGMRSTCSSPGPAAAARFAASSSAAPPLIWPGQPAVPYSSSPEAGGHVRTHDERSPSWAAHVRDR